MYPRRDAAGPVLAGPSPPGVPHQPGQAAAGPAHGGFPSGEGVPSHGGVALPHKRAESASRVGTQAATALPGATTLARAIRGDGLPHGHISIAPGDGRAWSGPIRDQMTLSTSYRVFMAK